MKIISYAMPETIQEAAKLIGEAHGTIVAGGAWLKLLPKTIDLAVDLSKLSLDQIVEHEDHLEIGAMVTLRTAENNRFLQDYCNGIVHHGVKGIMGVPIRNIATIGGSVAGRFGFSDLLPILLSLDAKVELYELGILSLENYLEDQEANKALLLKVILDKKEARGYHHAVKKTTNDFPVLALAVTRLNGLFRIVVGARPGRAKLAYEAMNYLNECPEITEEALKNCSELAANELTFGTNHRGSAEYRKQITKAIIYRGLEEVYYGH